MKNKENSLPLMQEGKDFTVSKPWVWLTYEEIDEIYEEYGECRKYGYEEAIQKKLKEKNT